MSRSLTTLVLATTLFCFCAAAQAPTGTLQGRVDDPNAAAVPDAKITVENQATGVKQTLTTNSDGRFVQPYLPSGMYRMTVEKAGFSKYVTSDIKIDVQSTVSLNVALKLGEVSATIEVQADVAQLKTETTAASTTITTKQLHDLPTGRNPFSLATLTPGVIPAGGGSTPWISGGRNASSEILIDGNTAIVPENNVSINDGGYVPIIDSVGEVTVIKNSMAAEYGRTGGGVITVSTRSGTNDLHFGLFEYFRNPALNANSWVNNRNNTKRANCCSRNEFGFNVGGPVIIPGLYNGRNKTFIFWSQQFTKAPGSSNPTGTVPIQAWRDGNFADLKNGAGQPIIIYDPLQVDSSTAGVRSPFPGNIIPRNRFDAVAVKMLTYWPQPNNVPTNAFTNATNFKAQGGTKNSDNKFDSRIDHNFTENFRVYLRGSYENNPQTPFNGFGNPGSSVNSGDGPTWNTFPNIAANMVYTLNPTTIVSLNLGFGQKDVGRAPLSAGTKPSDLGFPANVDAIAGLNSLEFPQVNTGSGNLGQASFTTLTIKSYAYTVHGDMTKIFQKHTIKVGGEYRESMLNFTQYGSPDGSFTFNTSPTVRVVNQTAPTTEGFGFASFLLGLPGNSNMNHSFSAATASPYVMGFIDDTWKVSRKLTLNIGLRWDTDIPRTERYNRLNHFDIYAPSPLAGKVPAFPNLKGGWVFQGADHRRQVNSDLNNWGPRFGFAYQVNQKTVFRSAYGISYSGSSYTAGGTSGSSGTQGFQSNTPINITNDNYRTIQTYLSNPYASGFSLPLGAAGGPGTDLGGAIGGGNGGVFLDNQIPIIQQWNANLQRELPGGFVIEAGYLGSKGQHLIDGESNMPITQLPASTFALGETLLNSQVANPFYHVEGLNKTTNLYTQPTVQYKQLLSPYPQYTGITAFRIPQANSNYHSFTLEVNKRYSHGLQLLASFTGGKLLDDASQTVSFLGQAGTKQDYYNRAGDKSISWQDVSKRLVVAFNYDIPVGKGRPLFASMPKPVDFVIGGWQVNGIWSAQTAIPLAITLAANNAGIGSPGQRPLHTGGSAKKSGPIDQRLTAANPYFVTTGFSITPNFAFGNISRFSPDLRGPSQFNMDFSLFKGFKFHDRLQAQIRAESFNFFNHPTWANPGTQVNNVGTFGIITQANGNRTVQVALKISY